MAVSGDTVVVGAFRGSQQRQGINGNQDNNSAHHAGAAYVFSTSMIVPCPLTVRVMMKPNELSPADQRLVQVTADLKVNPCVQNPKIKLISVKSSDPDRGLFAETAHGTSSRPFSVRTTASSWFVRKPSRDQP